MFAFSVFYFVIGTKMGGFLMMDWKEIDGLVVRMEECCEEALELSRGGEFERAEHLLDEAKLLETAVFEAFNGWHFSDGDIGVVGIGMTWQLFGNARVGLRLGRSILGLERRINK
ncbi:hypothetical protein AB6887_03240 [Carnobacterium divergens]|nr:hypothetical protein [Carnobacterium divergens]